MAISKRKQKFRIWKKRIGRWAKRYNVHVEYADLGNSNGEAYVDKIVLNSDIGSWRELLYTFFHELGHIHCHRTGLWSSFHNPDKTGIEYAQRIIRTSLKAERWVDRWACREVRKHYPKFRPYCPYYHNPPQYIRDVINENGVARYRNALTRWNATKDPHERFHIVRQLLND